jgi:hypothetical protein
VANQPADDPTACRPWTAFRALSATDGGLQLTVVDRADGSLPSPDIGDIGDCAARVIPAELRQESV